MSQFTKLVPQLFGALALLTLGACQPHDPEVTRAFWDLDYEHQLVAQKAIPVTERLYAEGGPQDPVLRTNVAPPSNYVSIWRTHPSPHLPNPARDAHFPPKEDHHGDTHGAHAEPGHAAPHGETHAPAATHSPQKEMFPANTSGAGHH